LTTRHEFSIEFAGIAKFTRNGSQLRDFHQVSAKRTRQLGGLGALELALSTTRGYLSGSGPSFTIFSSNAASCCGPLGNVVDVLPPYIISPEQLHTASTTSSLKPSKPCSDAWRGSVKLISL